MKLIVFNFDRKGKTKKGSARPNYERILFMAFIITFLLLVVVQAALTNPSVRTFLTVSNDLEGQPLAQEEFFYNEGKIRLGLIGSDRNENVCVLLNGDEIAAFSTGILDIAVKDGDVIEIDGSRLQNEAEVEILSASDNITTQCIGKKVKVKSNIKKLIKLSVEE